LVSGICSYSLICRIYLFIYILAYRSCLSPLEKKRQKKKKAHPNRSLNFSSILFLLLIVSRSKLVPDFALTAHFLHLVIVSLYSHSLPDNWLWWALQMASSALMTFLGIWVCQRRELQPISFGTLTGRRSSNSPATASLRSGAQNQTPADGGNNHNNHNDNGHEFESDDHQLPGVSRGRGRGRARDSGGEYEMISMKELEEGVS
jgi:protein SYS1